MKALIHLAWHSAWNRRATLLLTVLSIAMSAFMLLGVERVRGDVRDSFTSAVSGVDLVVGPRSGAVQLLLYSVFHLGSATSDVGVDSIAAIATMPQVEWVVPISLGDSHRGHPVVGTSTEYFHRFRYGESQPLRIVSGKAFAEPFDAVIGAEVAARLGYQPGSRLVLSHGSGEIDFGPGASLHDDKPFTVTGVLARTGSPVDRAVYIPIEGMDALHAQTFGGMVLPGLSRKAVTAAFVGLKNRSSVFSVQRQINRLDSEPLSAVLPGVTLDELWDVVGLGENALRVMSGLVALVSIAGLVSLVLAGLNERRRELAVLRAVGARPSQLVLLLALEGAMVALAGALLGVVSLCAGTLLARSWVQSTYGIGLQTGWPTETQWLLLAVLVATGWLASLLPGWRAYRLSLADGLSPRT